MKTDNTKPPRRSWSEKWAEANAKSARTLGMAQPLTIKDAMAATRDFQDHLAPKKESAASTGELAAAAVAPPTRYEYKVLKFTTVSRSQGALNRLGRKGWEVVESDRASVLSWGKRYSVTLRRPVA